MDSSGLDPMIGRTLLGRFRVNRLIGEGQMARVYVAHQESMSREVAIKVLRKELSKDTAATARFRREAESVARLCSPHSIEFFDFGTTDEGELVIVMELLQGQTLRQRMEHVGLMPLHVVHSIIAQISTALGEAHAAGIIHRDLKPENVILVDCPSPISPFAKVLDFGLAMLHDAPSGNGRITDKFKTVGTPAYLSPEAAMAGGVADWRADLYALGIITFELVTGTRPFDGKNPLQVLLAHARDPIPSALSIRPKLPAAVDPFFATALAKKPQERIASAELFATSLGEALADWL